MHAPLKHNKKSEYIPVEPVAATRGGRHKQMDETTSLYTMIDNESNGMFDLMLARNLHGETIGKYRMWPGKTANALIFAKDMLPGELNLLERDLLMDFYHSEAKVEEVHFQSYLTPGALVHHLDDYDVQHGTGIWGKILPLRIERADGDKLFSALHENPDLLRFEEYRR